MKLVKSVYQDNSVYGNDLFFCLKELGQGTLGRLCLFVAILIKTSPLEGILRQLGPKGSQRLTLVLGLIGLCPRVPSKPKLFGTFKASGVMRTPVKVGSVSISAHIMLGLET
jgi:hypothetical protein